MIRSQIPTIDHKLAELENEMTLWIKAITEDAMEVPQKQMEWNHFMQRWDQESDEFCQGKKYQWTDSAIINISPDQEKIDRHGSHMSRLLNAWIKHVVNEIDGNRRNGFVSQKDQWYGGLFIKDLLARGAWSDALKKEVTDQYFGTLVSAIWSHQIHATQALLHAGLKAEGQVIHQSDKSLYDYDLFSMAVSYDSLSAVQLLSGYQPALEKADQSGNTPFLVACMNHRMDHGLSKGPGVEKVNSMIDDLHRLGCNPTAVNTKTGAGALLMAIENNDLSLYHRLIEMGVHQHLDQDNQQKIMSLAAASASSELLKECINLALSFGVDINEGYAENRIRLSVAPSGHTPLQCAVMADKLENVKMVIAQGAQIELSRLGLTAMDCARVLKDTSIKNYLKEVQCVLEEKKQLEVELANLGVSQSQKSSLGSLLESAPKRVPSKTL